MKASAIERDSANIKPDGKFVGKKGRERERESNMLLSSCIQ